MIAALLASGCDDAIGERRVGDCRPTAEEISATHPQSAALETLLSRAVRSGLPGALMAVREGDQTWFGAAGVPDLNEPQRPFEVCHMVPIKSVTKTFVAVRIMQLVQDDQLELDSTLASLLPDGLLVGIPSTSRITVRHLLDHSSGLRHYPEVLGYVADFLNQPDRSQSVAKALDAVRGLDLYFEPGSSFHYSNTNYILLQHIVETLTGRTLSHELKRSIFQPLGLERTHFHQDQPLSGHVPSGYMDLYGNGDAHRIDTLDDVSSAAGGMESTLGDLIRFSVGLFEESTLLSSDSVHEMMATSAVDEAEWEYDAVGLGLKLWRTPLGDVYGHTGEDTGYKSFWHYAPDRRLTWVLLLNSNYGQFESRALQLREDVLELLAQP